MRSAFYEAYKMIRVGGMGQGRRDVKWKYVWTSKEVWSLCGEWTSVFYRVFSSMNLFWDFVFEEALKVDNLSLMLTTLWPLWFNRNMCVYEGLCAMPAAIVLSAQQKIIEFQDIWPTMSRVDGSISHGPEGSQSWLPPQPGVIKINVDASFDSYTLNAGLGLVARNWEGNVLFSAVTRMDHIQSSLFAEVLAI
ncbi:hypothetical protein REPUB_Repub13aG0044100 [Reevesia pubescens]